MERNGPGTIHLVSWNIEDRILDVAVQDVLLQSHADVILLVEGFAKAVHDTPALKAVFARLRRAGYHVSSCLYGDSDGRLDQHGYVVLIKDGIDAHGVSFATPDAGNNRHMIAIRIHDLLVIGGHLDDRKIVTRLAQLGGILKYIRETGATKVVLMGGLNSTYHHEPWLLRFVIRVLLWLLTFVHEAEPQASFPRATSATPVVDALEHLLGRIKSLARRFGDMMSLENQVLDYLLANGWREADVQHRPTKLLSAKLTIPLAQLDHVMLHGGGMEVVEIAPMDAVKSDHLGLTATIRF